MKVWIVSFFVLFGMAELYQWLKHLTLPLPIYILGGAFLAIASNYERFSDFSLPGSQEDPSAQNSQNLFINSIQKLKILPLKSKI